MNPERWRSAGGPWVAALTCCLSACSGHRPVAPLAIVRADPPAFQQVAAAYNGRVAPLGRVRAQVVLQFTYVDEQSQTHMEQGEGLLQVVRPDRLALSVSKAGKRIFWFGCDPERYWWLDLADERVASVGRHDQFGMNPGRRLAIGIQPLDLILLLGITPLDPAAPGATQWSDDGRLLGVTTRTHHDGYERLWLDPDSFAPSKVELYDAGRSLVLVADLADYGPVEIRGYGGARPTMGTRIRAYHPDSQTLVRLDLSGMEDRRMSDEAFDLKALLETLQVKRVVDLDAAP